MRKIIGATLLGAALLTGYGKKELTEQSEARPNLSTFAKNVALITPHKDVLFTIDDGPSKYTLEIAKTLDSLGYKGIFFLVGEGITEKNRAMLIDVLKMGHHIGNHSYSHPNFAKLSLKQAEQEISKTDTLLSSLIQDSGIQQTKYMRYPYGVGIKTSSKKNFQSFLDSLGYGKPMHWHMTIGLSDRAHQAREKNIDSINPGDTIVIHERPRAVAEIEKIVAELKKKEGKHILSQK